MKTEVQFVVDELLPAGLAFLAGLPYSGRTWLSLYLALQVANGRKFFDEYTTKQGKVLYFADDHQEERIARRLKELTNAMGLQVSEGDSSLQFCFVGPQNHKVRNLHPLQWADYLKELVREFRLVIVDSHPLATRFAILPRAQKKDAIIKLLELRGQAIQSGATAFFVISAYYKPYYRFFQTSLSTAWKLIWNTRCSTGKRTLVVEPCVPGGQWRKMKFPFAISDLTKGFVDTQKPRRVLF